MVVSLVLEHDEPVFFFAVDLGLDLDAAGVDLFRLVQVVCLVVLLQVFGADAGHIHEAQVLVSVSVYVLSHGHVFCKGFADDLPVRGIVEADVFEGRVKGGVSAVIGPVGVDYFQFCQGRIAVLRVFVISLDKLNVFRTHGESHFPAVAFQLLRRVVAEAFDDGYIFRNCHLHIQRFRLFVCCDLGVYRVDAVALDLLKLSFFQLAFQHDDAREFYHRLHIALHEADTLCC